MQAWASGCPTKFARGGCPSVWTGATHTCWIQRRGWYGVTGKFGHCGGLLKDLPRATYRVSEKYHHGTVNEHPTTLTTVVCSTCMRGKVSLSWNGLFGSGTARPGDHLAFAVAHKPVADLLQNPGHRHLVDRCADGWEHEHAGCSIIPHSSPACNLQRCSSARVRQSRCVTGRELEQKDAVWRCSQRVLVSNAAYLKRRQRSTAPDHPPAEDFGLGRDVTLF